MMKCFIYNQEDFLKVALKLLIKGFLLSELDINDEQKSLLTHSIDSYWR